jgi:hypothetical protein
MYTRLHRSRWFWLMAVLALVLTLGAVPILAEAGVDFCNSDPLVKIGSKMVSIKVGVDKTRLADVDGIVQVVVVVPRGAPTTVVYVSQLYFAQVAHVQTNPDLAWNDSGPNTIEVKALVPGAEPRFATRLEVSSAGSRRTTTGKSDGWMSLAYTLR